MKRYIILITCALAGTISCNNDNSALLELENLRNQIKEDSIFRENWARESREIDSLLSNMTNFTNNAQQGFLEDEDLTSKTN